MATIGSRTVQIWRGELKGPRRRLRTHERPGVNGTGVVRQAYRCPLSTVFTIETAADAATADQIEAEYQLMEGTEQSLVDANGTAHANAMIFAVDVTKERRAKIVGGAGTADTYEVQATWQIILPYTAPGVRKGGLTQ